MSKDKVWDDPTKVKVNDQWSKIQSMEGIPATYIEIIDNNWHNYVLNPPDNAKFLIETIKGKSATWFYI